jgi:RimJ/RimL family protein N-acetyltransferase
VTQLETPRLILRPWAEEDAPALYENAKDPEIGPITGWPAHRSVDESRQVIRDVLSVRENYAIILKRHALVNRPIGCVALMLGQTSSIGLPDDEGEIGYWIGRRWWGRGLMPEAVIELMRHAFVDLGLAAVWCGYDEGNDKSRRVQEKVGLKPHHVLKDRVRPVMGDVKTEYLARLTREEWVSARAADPVDDDTIARQQAEDRDLCENIERISLIRAGGQTGSDRGGLDAGRDHHVPICGWCPKGGLAEDLPDAPGLLGPYPELVETPSEGYVQRTAWNVRDSHATLIVAPDGLEPKGGTAMTVEFAKTYGRPVLVLERPEQVDEAWRWIEGLGHELTLNVAGPRASKVPSAYGMTRDVVGRLLEKDAR